MTSPSPRGRRAGRRGGRRRRGAERGRGAPRQPTEDEAAAERRRRRQRSRPRRSGSPTRPRPRRRPSPACAPAPPARARSPSVRPRPSRRVEPPAAVAAVTEAEEPREPEEEGKPPRAKRLWARFLAASMVIVDLDRGGDLGQPARLPHRHRRGPRRQRRVASCAKLTEVEGGEPQTILILGSDKRLGHRGGDPGRSDTTILLRVDPDQDAIALLSIPRDLRVNIPGVGVDKFNAAYSAGGPKQDAGGGQAAHRARRSTTSSTSTSPASPTPSTRSTASTSTSTAATTSPRRTRPRRSTSRPATSGCAASTRSSTCASATSTTTSSAPPASRTSCARRARSCRPQADRGPQRAARHLHRVHDLGHLDDAVQLLELLKTFVGVAVAPVREVHFPAELGTDLRDRRATSAIKEAVQQFLGTEGTPGERPPGESPAAESPTSRRRRTSPRARRQAGGDGGTSPTRTSPRTTSSARRWTTRPSRARRTPSRSANKRKKDGDPMVDFPIYYPTRLVPGLVHRRATRARS